MFTWIPWKKSVGAASPPPCKLTLTLVFDLSKQTARFLCKLLWCGNSFQESNLLLSGVNRGTLMHSFKGCMLHLLCYCSLRCQAERRDSELRHWAYPCINVKIKISIRNRRIAIKICILEYRILWEEMYETPQNTFRLKIDRRIFEKNLSSEQFSGS